MRTKDPKIKERNAEIVQQYISEYLTYDVLGKRYDLTKESIRRVIEPVVPKEKRNKIYKIRTAFNNIRHLELLIRDLKQQL